MPSVVISVVFSVLSVLMIFFQQAWAANIVWTFVIIVDIFLFAGLKAAWNDKDYLIQMYTVAKLPNWYTAMFYGSNLLLFIGAGKFFLGILWMVQIGIIVAARLRCQEITEEEILND